MDTPDAHPSGSFNHELMDYLQILTGPTTTGRLSLRYDYANGFLHLHKGNIVHAEFEGASGLNACYAMLKLPQSTVHWEDGLGAPGHSMNKPLDVLLMEFLLTDGEIPQDDELSTAAEGSSPPPATTNEVLFAEVMNGSQEGQVFEITRPCVLIGSDPRCELHLPDPTVSRNHCQIRLCEGQILFTDLNSRNGTRLNDKAVTSGSIKSGDHLQVGQTLLHLHLELKRPAAANTRKRRTQKIEVPTSDQKFTLQQAKKTEPIRWIGNNRDKEDRPKNGGSVLRHFFKV